MFLVYKLTFFKVVKLYIHHSIEVMHPSSYQHICTSSNASISINMASKFNKPNTSEEAYEIFCDRTLES